MRRHFARIGAVAAVVGALTLFSATLLHPMNADPNDPETAFAEYADDHIWVGSHLLQFAGIAVLGVALLSLAAVIEPGLASAWARIGVLGTAASIATAAALQAVDGVALKVVVDRWATLSGDARARAFEAAFAVRQIEIGLASLLSLLFGLTFGAYGIAIVFSRTFSHWLGWLAVAGGLGTVAAGITQAYTGFSAVAMSVSMPASLLVLVWTIAAARALWQLARRPNEDARVADSVER